MTRRLLAPCALAAAVLVGVTAGCSGHDPPAKAAATVDGKVIGSSETEALLQTYLQSAEGQADKSDELTKKTLTKFVVLYQIKHVLLQRLGQQMQVSADPMPPGGDVPNELAPPEAFAAAGVRPQDFAREYEDGQLSKAIAEKLFPNVDVADDALHEEYDRRASVNDNAWRVSAQIALLSSVDAAQQLVARSQRGDAFDQSARALSAVDVGTAEVTPMSPLPRPVLDAVTNLQQGQTGGPVTLDGGRFAVVRVDHREDFPRLTFEQARGDLTKFLADQQRQSLFQEWFNKKLGSADIWVNPRYGRWDPKAVVVR